ncbi:MAG: hypothetical protein WCQ95_03965 [Bacteroidota bacterium]
MKLTLKEHIDRSKQAVAANKAKGNRHADFLATMYAQPSRFIEEILQNTEDAYARKIGDSSFKKIRFKLFENCVEIHHNGKNFDEEDLMSVTTFANTTKKNNSEINQIGKFGIGFKSVFSITNQPEIHSGKYHFRISDYEILVENQEQKPDDGFNTLIVLPFKKSNKLECFNAVKQGLLNLNEYYLIFLKQIQRIEIFESETLFCEIEKQVSTFSKNIQKIIFQKKFFQSYISEKNEVYLLVAKTELSKKPQPELAFQVIESENSFRFVEIPDAPLFAYFPTKMSSGLNFLIHAPFTTNPLRDFIPFDAVLAPENMQLLHEISRLFVLGMNCFLKTGLYDLHFLSKLPLRKPSVILSGYNKGIVYQEFYTALKSFLLHGKTIPIKNHKYATNTEVLIPADELMYGFLQEADLKMLFQKSFFIDSLIINESYTELRDYFSSELQIKIADAESFGFRIKVSSSFLENRPVKWFIEFYKYLHFQQKLWDTQHMSQYYSIRTSPIIMTAAYTLEAAYDDNQIAKVFLSNGKKDFLPVVNPRLFSNEFSRTFFNDLEIKQPDVVDDVIYNIIPQFKNGCSIANNNYFKKLDRVLLAYTEASYNRNKILIESLKNAPWVPARNNEGELYFYTPTEVYLPDSLLKKYFKSTTGVWFAEPLFISKLKRKYPDIVESFFKEIGLFDFPRIHFSDNSVPKFEGFDDFIRYVDYESSNAFLKIILKAPEYYLKDEVLHYLKRQNWILTETNRFEAPEAMCISDVSTKYKLTVNEKAKLQILLNITSNKYVFDDTYFEWKPSVKPDEININEIKNLTAVPVSIEGNFNVLNTIQTNLNLFEYKETNLKEYSEADFDNIYQWCCDFLLLYLKHEFVQPEYKVERSRVSDFTVYKNENIFLHVFLCAKTDLMQHFYFPAEKLVEICKLHSFQENTLLYCVESVGTANVSIKIIFNPFQQISSGKIQFKGNLFLFPC